MRPLAPGPFGDRQRLGALLAVLALVVVGTVVASALLAPPAYWLVDSLAPGRFPFRRVLRRVALLVVALLLVALRRPVGITRWRDLGFVPWRQGRRSFALAAAVGAGVIALLYVVELKLGTRVAAGTLTAVEAVSALLGAVVIGLSEEALTRGAFLYPFGRLSGWRFWVANLAVSAVYSTAHFGRGGGEIAEVGWTSGWHVWGRLLPAVADHFEAWVGLLATGALFYALARRQEQIWGAAGLHAGAVLALQIGGEWSDPAVADRSLLLVNGRLPGYGLAAVAFVGMLAVWRRGRRPEAG